MFSIHAGSWAGHGGSRLNRLAAPVLITLLTAGCSAGPSDAEQARDLASSACTVETEASSGGFDPETVAVEELSRLSAAATLKSELSAQAATLDDRWSLLADASAAISAFAQRLLDVRMEGEDTAAAITPAMWEQYKTASNAYIAECQDALADPSPS